MLLMHKGVRDRLRNQWTSTTTQAGRFRGRLLSVVFSRLATAETHQATPLLGYDIALERGGLGLFRYLPEFTTGTELGRTVQYGTTGEARAPSKRSSWNSAKLKIRREHAD